LAETGDLEAVADSGAGAGAGVRHEGASPGGNADPRETPPTQVYRKPSAESAFEVEDFCGSRKSNLKVQKSFVFRTGFVACSLCLWHALCA
jgi:hypothetical protein